MSKKRYVKISIDELADLIADSKTFKALDCGGVDNWEWYGESLADYVAEDEKYEDFSEYVDDITSEESILRNYPLVDITEVN